jgi:hypothetical protein
MFETAFVRQIKTWSIRVRSEWRGADQAFTNSDPAFDHVSSIDGSGPDPLGKTR